MSGNTEKFALISLYEKDGVVEFARELQELGYGILSTGNTAKYLSENGLNVTLVSEYTGASEILEGRVKTLHPKIHGGILARRSNEYDIEELKRENIGYIDVVVVNLYPFFSVSAEAKRKGADSQESLVEFIDIGGPTMLRAAAKNCEFVLSVSDPEDYPNIISELRSGEKNISFRRKLASKVFRLTAAYDLAVSRYFSLDEILVEANGSPKSMAAIEGYVLESQSELRYGENPHQKAALYGVYRGEKKKDFWKKLAGKEISYNNLLDFQASVNLLLDLEKFFSKKASAVVVKHNNPCGAAVDENILEAFKKARACDPISAFGGIVALSKEVSAELAESILEGFVEVIAAPSFSKEALEIFSKKRSIRLLECNYSLLKERKSENISQASAFFDSILLQERDEGSIDFDNLEFACGDKSCANRDEYCFSWTVCKHVKSNAIVLSKGLQALGIGAGQMSRVDAARLAVQRAKLHEHSLDGSICASDAFLPFADTLEVVAQAGAEVLIQPGGSVRDKEVIAEAEKRGITMAFTGMRHFRH